MSPPALPKLVSAAGDKTADSADCNAPQKSCMPAEKMAYEGPRKWTEMYVTGKNASQNGFVGRILTSRRITCDVVLFFFVIPLALSDLTLTGIGLVYDTRLTLSRGGPLL